MENENILGTEKIGKLIRKFSVPCIISLVVNSLYNIVDQIFIGWGVGYLGNGATNVVFPLTMICLAFALMFGDGSSAYMSLKLGEKKKEEASKGVANGITFACIIAVIFFLITIIFLPQLINVFGCTDALREYALNYGYFIAIGLPFMMIGTTLNSIIRADGSPKYAMTSMLTGAILNIILDPVFIFVFNMGVEGAAIATSISQFVTFLMNILYIRKFKSLSIKKENFKKENLKLSLAGKVSMLGISSFITQMAIVVVMAVENNLLAKYGKESEFGSEIPITVLGIVMKISQILNSVIIGIAAGTQPIIGYNYGAGKYDRVKKVLKIVLTLSVAVSTFAFILFQTIPDKLILIFGSGDALYMEFACLAFRTYLLLVICNGIQIPTGIFFQAIGKGIKSAIISLSRQILFLIPAFFILGYLFGIHGMLFAGPFADGLAFIIASTLLVLEVKSLGRTSVKSRALIDNKIKNDKINKHIVITISREYGSGGRYVGRLVANRLGIKLYDKEFVIKVAKETGLSEEYVEQNEQKRSVLAPLNNGYYSEYNNSDELFTKESELIKEFADKESCVIIGRCADNILENRDNVVRVFIYGTMENKIKRVIKHYGIETEEKAKKEIERIDKQRGNHYKYYTGKEWKNFANYDICINSDILGVKKSAEMICSIVKQKELQ